MSFPLNFQAQGVSGKKIIHPNTMVRGSKGAGPNADASVASARPALSQVLNASTY